MDLSSNPQNPSQLLANLIDEEWEYRLQQDPLFATMVGDSRYQALLPEVSEANEENKAQKYEGFLKQLQALPVEALSPSERVSLQMLQEEVKDRLAQYRFGAFRMPVTKMNGPHSYLTDAFALTPFQTLQDYQQYIERLCRIETYLSGMTQMMRSGLRRGLMPAYHALAGLEDALDDLASETFDANPDDHFFFQPFQAIPASVSPADQDHLRQSGRDAILLTALPAFRAFRKFIVQEYLPAARASDGISSLPGGADYYQHLIQKFTTLDLTVEQVHRMGLEEVARIRAEMEAVMRESGFSGSFHEYLAALRADPRYYVTEPEQLMEKVALIMKRMDGELPRLFRVLPRTPYGMRQTPAHIAPRSTSAYYFPATGDGKTAGYYYVNTYDLTSRPLYEYEALSFHEAVPGHHLQIALQQELENIPDFRRFATLDAFIEGWALYAERLGLEVGFYQEPSSNFGRLTFEMWRACRLVVDTGIHAFSWTRDQAIQYMAEQTALSMLNIQNEVDRYIAWPGQALAYKIGEMKIRELRAAAQEKLGQAFDLRAFHQILLEEGPIPLSVLENKVIAWIGTGQN